MLARDRALAALLAALPGLAASGIVQAQGLGEIVLNSSLNEPLDATIPLFQLDGLDESQIRVGMASESDFARSDIPRPDFLRNIEFTLEIDGDTGMLHLTSPVPVVEPYLNFLVDARWPSGRMLREYTVLLDLPTFSQAAAAPVQPASRAPEPEPAPPPRETPAQANGERGPAPPRAVVREPDSGEAPEEGIPAQPEEEPSQSAGQEPDAELADEEPAVPAEEGELGQAAAAAEAPPQEEESSVTVAPNDTLWEIAVENRPGDAVSVQQMMLAIQRANEDAFIDGNINGLRTGQVLRIPSIDEVLAVNRAQAVEQVALQNSLYDPAAGELDAQPLVGGGDGAGPATLEAGDELSVLTAGDDARDAGEGQDDLDATVAELETALMLSEENLDRATLENEELLSRLADLEAQIETLQNIIAIEDQRLAQLQAELAAQAEEEAAAAVAAAPPAPVQDEPASAAPPVVNTPPAAGLLDSLVRNPLVMGGGLAGLVMLVLGFLIWRRRRDEQDRGEEEVFEAGAASADDVSTAVSPAPALVREEPGFGEPIWDEDEDEEIEDSETESAAQVPDWLSQDPDFSLDDEEEIDLEESAELSPQGASDASLDAGEDFGDLDLEEGADEDLAGAFDLEDGMEEDGEGESGEEAAALGLAVEETAEIDMPEIGMDEVDTGEVDMGEVETTELDMSGLEIAGDDADAEDLNGESLSAEGLLPPEEESAAPAFEEEGGLDFHLEEDDGVSTGPAETAAGPGAEEPELVEFRLADVAGPETPQEAEQEEEPESFEFRLDEAEPAPAEPVQAMEAAEEEETIEFDLDASEPESAPAATRDGEDEDILDISFDIDEEKDAEQDELSWQGNDEDPLDLGNIDIDEELLKVDEEDEDEIQPLTDRDETSTKLDLAVAYEAMGDLEGALEILDEVIAEGSGAQVDEARELKTQWSKTEAGE